VATKEVNGDAIAELLDASRAASPAARAEIGTLVPWEGPYAATYPADTWATCVRLLAADLFPGVPADEAQRRLGHQRIDAFAKRLSAKVIFALARISPRDRSLARIVRGLARGASYIEGQFRPGAAHDEIWISDVTGIPGFFQGMIEQLARRGGLAIELSIHARAGDSCTFRTLRT